MPPVLALTACTAAVLWLLRLEHRRNPHATLALWVPTLWMLIAGSRAVGRWFAVEAPNGDFLEGSLADRVVLLALICTAVVIVQRRHFSWGRFLRDNAAVILLFGLMAASILWVDAPFVSLKRWIKSVGPVLMACVIVTEPRPLAALESIFRRCAYILIPFSEVLIRYYPSMGRAYGRWDGVEMWVGVTTHKNSLGQLCAVSVFFLAWSLLRQGRGASHPVTRTEKIADVAVAASAMVLLKGPGTFSATSIAILAMGLGVVLGFRAVPAMAQGVTSQLKFVALSMSALYFLLADTITAAVTSLFGRSETLTGRATDIWPVVLALAAKNPFLGLGYGGAWGLGGELSMTVGVEQAHNGYLDVYLQLGAVGVMVLIVFFMYFCSTIQTVMSRDADWGAFGVSFLVMTLLYNLSETAFFDVYIGAAMVLVPIALLAQGATVEKRAMKAVATPRRRRIAALAHARTLVNLGNRRPAQMPGGRTFGRPQRIPGR